MFFALMVKKKKDSATYSVNFHDPSPISFLTHIGIVVARQVKTIFVDCTFVGERLVVYHTRQKREILRLLTELLSLTVSTWRCHPKLLQLTFRMALSLNLIIKM